MFTAVKSWDVLRSGAVCGCADAQASPQNGSWKRVDWKKGYSMQALILSALKPRAQQRYVTVSVNWRFFLEVLTLRMTTYWGLVLGPPIF